MRDCFFLDFTFNPSAIQIAGFRSRASRDASLTQSTIHTPLVMAIDPPSSLSPAERRFRKHRQEYQDYLPLTERVQAGLREDVDLLQSQEGWDIPTQQGIAEWVNDRDNIFRFLTVGVNMKLGADGSETALMRRGQTRPSLAPSPAVSPAHCICPSRRSHHIPRRPSSTSSTHPASPTAKADR